MSTKRQRINPLRRGRGVRPLAKNKKVNPGAPRTSRDAQIVIRSKETDPRTANKGARTCPPGPPVGASGVFEHRSNEITRGIEVEESVTFEALSAVRLNEESLPVSVVGGVHITLADQDTIKDEAVRITNSDLSGMGSINDPRMGVIEKDMLCPTCCQGLTCPGHYGAIHLNQAMLHPLYIRWIIRVLKSVCNSCGELLVPVEQLRMDGILGYEADTRMRKIEAMSMGRLCLAGSGEHKPCPPNPKFLPKPSKDSGSIKIEIKKSTLTLSVEEVEARLRRISPRTANALGFEFGSHPRNFILRYLPVIPPQARPNSVQEGRVYTDMITSLYIRIINANNAIMIHMESGNAEKLNKARTDLAAAITALIDKSDGAKMKKIGGRGNIMSTISGKKGFLRKALQGKRVNYSGRAVITPGPDLRMWELGVPEIMAMQFSVPETVTPANKAWLESLIRRGKVNYVIPYGGKKAKVIVKVAPGVLNTHKLKYGDQVKRQLLSGDRLSEGMADQIIYNRNPTLHRFGFVGFEVRVEKGLTLRVPLPTTTTTNSDFDGDEANVHVVQTPAARAEVATVMSIKNCKGIGVIFDALTAATLLTIDDTYVEPDVYADCIMQMDHIGGSLIARTPRVGEAPNLSLFERKIEDLQKRGVPRHSGKGLFSMLLPVDFNYTRRGDGNFVNITGGILIRGYIDEDDIGPYNKGAKHRNIVNKIFDQYGRDAAAVFISDATRMLQRWITHRGFSIGFGDCFPFDIADSKRLKEIVHEELTKANVMLEALGGPLEDPIANARRERDVKGVLDVAKTVGQVVTKEVLHRKPKEDLVVQGEQVTYIEVRGAPGRPQIITEVGARAIMVEDMDEISKKHYGDSVMLLRIDSFHVIVHDMSDAIRITNRDGHYIKKSDGTIHEIYDSEKNSEFASEENALVIMATSGAKGNMVNLAQITSLLAQQFLSGERIPNTLYGDRALAYYESGSLDPEARGFISSSYLTGLKPGEFFFAAMGGREGLVDTAVNTSVTGSFQRNAVKGMEGIMLRKDGTVRNSSGKVVQLTYGDDGLNPEKVKMVKIDGEMVPTFVNVAALADKINMSYGAVTHQG